MRIRVKKTEPIVDNLTESEEKRRQLILQVQEFLEEGCSVSEVSRRTGKNRHTIAKYREGDPDILCRSNKAGILDSYKDFIIRCLSDGMTQSETIRQLKQNGYANSESNARIYIQHLIREYQLDVNKYCSSETSTAIKGGAASKKYDYITRKGVFQHIWMDQDLTEGHRRYIWEEYPVLYNLDNCVREFRSIFENKSMPQLYLFIEKYKDSEIKEIASFARGLGHDIEAVENAVASDLSNGFVEGTNSKLKMMKRTMYGRCSRELLAAKLMYGNETQNG